MSGIQMDGGLHISFDLRLDAEQIARMDPAVIRALLGGVAQIVTAKSVVDQSGATPQRTPA